MTALERLETTELSVPLPRPLRLGAIDIPHREYAIVRAVADDGTVGSSYSLTRSAPIAATVERTIAPHLSGISLDDYAVHYEHAIAANACLGTNGIFWRALSLVDCAVHDMWARARGVPLYELLGGTPRSVPTLYVGGYPHSDETADSLSAGVAALAAGGPAGIKIASCGDHARDGDRLRQCRGAMPAAMPVMIDLHWSVTDADAFARIADGWGQHSLGWVEDPCAFDDFAGTSRLAGLLPFPVAAGDEQSGVRHFTQLMDLGRVGVVRADATVCGGIRAFLAVAAEAAERGLPVSCHGSTHLHAHLAAVAPNVAYLEQMRAQEGVESIHLLLASDLALKGGALRPTSGEGTGVEWDAEAVEHYSVGATL